MKLFIISRTMSCTGLLNVLDSSKDIFDCDCRDKNMPVGEFVWGFNCLMASFEPFAVVLVTNMKSKGYEHSRPVWVHCKQDGFCPLHYV
jgi:hypothetical protein